MQGGYLCRRKHYWFSSFLLFFNAKFLIFSILRFLFSCFFEQPCRWTPCKRNLEILLNFDLCLHFLVWKGYEFVLLCHPRFLFHPELRDCLTKPQQNNCIITCPNFSSVITKPGTFVIIMLLLFTLYFSIFLDWWWFTWQDCNFYQK